LEMMSTATEAFSFSTLSTPIDVPGERGRRVSY
jgi:hypothetical protein